jgi:hypothetical protein
MFQTTLHTKCFRPRCVQNVSDHVAYKMFQTTLRTKCFRPRCIQNVSDHVAYKMFQTTLHTKCFRPRRIQNVSDHVAYKMFQTTLHTKSKHTSVFYNFFFKSCRLWGKVEMWCSQTDHRWQHGACWIPKATNTLRICNTYCFSNATIVARTRLSVRLYVYRRLFYLTWTFRDMTPHSLLNSVRGLYPSFVLLTLQTDQDPRLKHCYCLPMRTRTQKIAVDCQLWGKFGGPRVAI